MIYHTDYSAPHVQIDPWLSHPRVWYATGNTATTCKADITTLGGYSHGDIGKDHSRNHVGCNDIGADSMKCAYVYVYTCMHSTYTYTQVSLTHTHSHAHTRTHTHTHAHMHTFTPTHQHQHPDTPPAPACLRTTHLHCYTDISTYQHIITPTHPHACTHASLLCAPTRLLARDMTLWH